MGLFSSEIDRKIPTWTMEILDAVCFLSQNTVGHLLFDKFASSRKVMVADMYMIATF